MKQNNDFFVEQSSNSEVKMQIVLAVFKLWLKDKKTKKSLSYIDLFSGPGTYDDGTFSTPVCILQEICAMKSVAQKFNIILNDRSAAYMAKLRRTIMNIRNANFFKTLLTSTRDACKEILKIKSDGNCFIFLDPWGWKGMNRNHINSTLQNKNCEIALLFSFNQFNRFVNFDKIGGIFDDLFDVRTLREIRKFCATNPKYKKEKFILEKFVEIITKNCPDCHCLPFKFKIERSSKTSHYLIFIIRDEKRFKTAQRELKRFSNYEDEILCYSARRARV
jgi:three-Cys-motif partner protein